MCLLVPGKIVNIKDDIATVDYDVEKRQAAIIDGEFKEGDYVLVQGKIVVQKVEEKEAKDTLELYKEAISE